MNTSAGKPLLSWGGLPPNLGGPAKADACGSSKESRRGKVKKIPILYEDNHLLIVVKPPNLLSQGDRTGDEDLHSLLKEYIREKYNKPGNVYLGLVHRLDRPTGGGVMGFAKTSKAAGGRLSEQIRTNTFRRGGYLAVVAGHPRPLQGSKRHFF